MFGADGRLYACEGSPQGDRIVSRAPQGGENVVVQQIPCQGLAIDNRRGVYFTDPERHIIWYVDRAGIRRQEVQDTLARPNGICFSPDHALLYVSDPDLKWVWSFQVQPDGSLVNGEPFIRLETGNDSSATGAAGMTVDSLGYVYITTRLGIQVCDQAGRVVTIIRRPPFVPEAGPPTNPFPVPDPLLGVAFGGPDLQDLYVVAGDKLFKRHLLRKGVLPWVPQKPPVPQL